MSIGKEKIKEFLENWGRDIPAKENFGGHCNESNQI